MRRIYVVFLFVAIAAFGLQAQTTLYETNFDMYTVGQGVALEAGDPWTTWSEAPGGSEDPLISDTYSNTPSNSVHVVAGNDAVLLLDDKVDGRYKVTFNIYVPDGKIAYYNLLAVFAGASSEWGLQVFFDTGGFGHIDAGTGDAATFQYNYDEWITIENYVDLDNDWADVFVNDGEYLIGYQWTLGTFGDEIPLQLGAMNIYAWDETGTPDFFMDDVMYQSMPLMEAPGNLTADVDGASVNLSWDAPANDTPESYYVFRNDVLLDVVTDGTTYENEIEFPGTYSYTVKAYYTPNGLSMASNEVDVEVEGGTDRGQVLLEIATGTWCQFCPGAAMGADEMIEEGYDVSVIEFHISDDYQNDASISRDNLYEVEGYPTSVFDGVDVYVGGSQTQSLFAIYEDYYEDRIDVPSVFDLELDAAVDVRGYSFDVNISSEQLWTYESSNMKLHVALTESHIPEIWFGLDEINFVLRDMFPSPAGTDITMEDIGDSQDLNITVEVPDTYMIENCELIAFIQDMDTKEVLNTQKVHLGQIVGVAEMGEQYTRVYPNPATDRISIEAESKLKNISIFSLNGQKVYEIAMDQHQVDLNVDFLETGMYLIRLETEAGSKVEKLSIR
jgi:hypothetical protein